MMRDRVYTLQAAERTSRLFFQYHIDAHHGGHNQLPNAIIGGYCGIDLKDVVVADVKNSFPSPFHFFVTFANSRSP